MPHLSDTHPGHLIDTAKDAAIAATYGLSLATFDKSFADQIEYLERARLDLELARSQLTRALTMLRLEATQPPHDTSCGLPAGPPPIKAAKTKTRTADAMPDPTL